jgi:hypothetical protein
LKATGGRREEVFFFEKKNQKTFAPWYPRKAEQLTSG